MGGRPCKRMAVWRSAPHVPRQLELWAVPADEFLGRQPSKEIHEMAAMIKQPVTGHEHRRAVPDAQGHDRATRPEGSLVGQEIRHLVHGHELDEPDDPAPWPADRAQPVQPICAFVTTEDRDVIGREAGSDQIPGGPRC